MTRKRKRKRLAKSELWMLLAVSAKSWAGQIEGSERSTGPFAESPDGDPLVARGFGGEPGAEAVSAVAGGVEADAVDVACRSPRRVGVDRGRVRPT